MPKPPINKTRPDWWPAKDTEICALCDIAPGAARGFTLTGEGAGDKLELIVWRDDNGAAEVLRGFVNKCPHMGLPLETFPDRFLNAMGDGLICSAHGAQFDATGACFGGPCKGAALISVQLIVQDRDNNKHIVLRPPAPHSASA